MRDESRIKLLLAFLPSSSFLVTSFCLSFSVKPLYLPPTTSHNEFWENYPFFLFHLSLPPEREKKNIECSLHSFAVLLCLSVAPPATSSSKSNSLKYIVNV